MSQGKSFLRIFQYSETSILLEFKAKPKLDLLNELVVFKNLLYSNLSGIKQITLSYKSLLLQFSNPLKKYKNPTIRFKLPLENDEILSKIYDQNRKIVNIKDIKKEQEAICIVHIRGIKFMKQQYICDIYINQMKIYVPKNDDFLIPDECIINDLDENNSDEEIIDDEVIREIDDKKQKLIRNKNKELKKLKILEEKIKKMTSQIDD
jgi:hypothetical protein